jgi:large subunit ribosomal protein L20
MARVKGGTTARARRKKVLKEASGYFGSKHRLFRTAKEQLLHSGVYAYRDRRQKKRDFRKLWITRINAACRENEISYSKFINGLTKAGLTVNRKMLSELAIDNAKAFSDLVVIAKNALEGKEYKPAKVELEKKVAKKEVAEVKEEKVKKVAVKKEVVEKAPAKKTTTKKTTTKK